MAGLILAGIGKGIADAGAAYAGGMMKGAEYEMQSQRDEDRERRAEERKTRNEEALKQRIISESEQVQQRASEAPARRVAGELDKYGSMVVGDSPEMSKEEIQKLVQDNPQYRAVYEKAGLIGADKMDPRLRASSDRAEAALSIGAHSSVIEAYSKERDSVLKEIKEENAIKRSEKRDDQRDRQLDIMEKGANARASNANKPAVDKPITGVDLERTAKAAERALSMQLGVPVKDVPETVARLKKQNKMDADTQGYLDEYNAALKEWQGYKRKPKDSGDNLVNTPPANRPPLGSFVRP
jgi:hypothetical protein